MTVASLQQTGEMNSADWHAQANFDNVGRCYTDKTMCVVVCCLSGKDVFGAGRYEPFQLATVAEVPHATGKPAPYPWHFRNYL